MVALLHCIVLLPQVGCADRDLPFGAAPNAPGTIAGDSTQSQSFRTKTIYHSWPDCKRLQQSPQGPWSLRPVSTTS
jgi:hypothetical protein